MANRELLARKQLFLDLAKDSSKYFGDGTRLTLWPNGRPEIWITSRDGNEGIRINASSGKHGLGLRVERFTGGAPITVHGNNHNESASIPVVDAGYLELCQFKSDEESQAYKQWVIAQSSEYYDDEEEARSESNVAAYKQGEAAAKAGVRLETVNDCKFPSASTQPTAYNAFLRGYWAERAGLNRPRTEEVTPA